MSNTAFPLKPLSRDLQFGDQGQDVGQLQSILKMMGYDIDPAELERQEYEKSTKEAAERFRRDCMGKDVGLLGKFLLQYLFGIDPEEAMEPHYNRGDGIAIRGYRESTDFQFQAFESLPWGTQGAPRAAEFASRFIGEREVGNNGGSLVRRVCNQREGLPWCGGFVNYIMDHSVSPRLFDQADYLSAKSFGREAAEHGAFRKPSSGYTPHVGDVVVFDRKGGGHVGIVSAVAADGTVTYISGNDGNAVRARTFKADHPPESLVGYADTHALAKAKGITLEQDREAPAIPAVAAAKHSDRAIARG
jgi:uncharacterized protein (TIGR02594 family)